jgi:Subtilase family
LICAPSSGAGGWGILTSDVTGLLAQSGAWRGYSEGDYTYEFGGTSSACPLVAGIAGLVLSVNQGLTAVEAKQILQKTARKIGSPKSYDGVGHSKEFGFGCVDADAAVNMAKSMNQQQMKKSVFLESSKSRTVKQTKSQMSTVSETTLSVSFQNQIRQLFRVKDISAMRTFGGFDLSKYEDVAKHSASIYSRLLEGSMPCDGAWKQNDIDLFKKWIDEGSKP